VLAEIGAGTVREVLALNKIDLVSEDDRDRLARRFPEGVQVSALTGEGLEELVTRVAQALPHPPVEVTVLVPYGRDEIVARLHREAEVLWSESTEEGTLLRARVGDRELAAVDGYVVGSRRRVG
jgi:GTP-binding protein HflX